jgi:hypothetical protein
MTTPTYRVWCVVSGGVTGTRQAWLKDGDGLVREWTDRAEAERQANVLTRRMNYHPLAKATFQYLVRKSPDYSMLSDKPSWEN